MSKEAMELALEALEVWRDYVPHRWDVDNIKAVTALREALAQPEPFAPDWVNYRQGKIDGALEGREWERDEILRMSYSQWFKSQSAYDEAIKARGQALKEQP